MGLIDRDKLERSNSEIAHYLGVVIDNKDPEFRGRAKIRVFGAFDDIEDDIILKALNAGSKSIQKLTEFIYVGEKYPHYHNLYISDLNRNLINCYNGNNTWITKTKDIIMENLYDTNLRMLRHTYNENKKYKKKYKSFREFLISQEEMSDNELEDDEEKFLYKHIYDKKIRSKIINELELLLYNKK